MTAAILLVIQACLVGACCFLGGVNFANRRWRMTVACLIAAHLAMWLWAFTFVRYYGETL